MKTFKMLLAAALIGGSAALGSAAPAQADRLGVTLGDGVVSVQYRDYRGRGQLTVRPRNVEAGDRVTLIGRDLPPGARLTLAVGRNPSRLERLRTVRSDLNGRVFATVTVPEWVRPGRNLFFALQVPGGGRTLALSRPVQVVDRGDDDRDEQITVTGVLLDPTATCPRLAGDDGRIYALAGNIRQFDTGDRVRVTGELADTSICNQRRTIDIDRIREAE